MRCSSRSMLGLGLIAAMGASFGSIGSTTGLSGPIDSGTGDWLLKPAVHDIDLGGTKKRRSKSKAKAAAKKARLKR